MSLSKESTTNAYGSFNILDEYDEWMFRIIACGKCNV